MGGRGGGGPETYSLIVVHSRYVTSIDVQCHDALIPLLPDPSQPSDDLRRDRSVRLSYQKHQSECRHRAKGINLGKLLRVYVNDPKYYRFKKQKKKKKLVKVNLLG